MQRVLRWRQGANLSYFDGAARYAATIEQDICQRSFIQCQQSSVAARETGPGYHGTGVDRRSTIAAENDLPDDRGVHAKTTDFGKYLALMVEDGACLRRKSDHSKSLGVLLESCRK